MKALANKATLTSSRHWLGSYVCRVSRAVAASAVLRDLRRMVWAAQPVLGATADTSRTDGILCRVAARAFRGTQNACVTMEIAGYGRWASKQLARGFCAPKNAADETSQERRRRDESRNTLRSAGPRCTRPSSRGRSTPFPKRRLVWPTTRRRWPAPAAAAAGASTVGRAPG